MEKEKKKETNIPAPKLDYCPADELTWGCESCPDFYYCDAMASRPISQREQLNRKTDE